MATTFHAPAGTTTFPPHPRRAPDCYACKGCGRLFRLDQLQWGRGRHLGQHPEHQYAPCGDSVTWWGKIPLWDVPPFIPADPPEDLNDDLDDEWDAAPLDPLDSLPDYGGAFDGFIVTSDAGPGL